MANKSKKKSLKDTKGTYFTISYYYVLFCTVLYANSFWWLFWLQVALIDVNKSVGNDLKTTLAEEYGRDRAEFYAADVSSEEDFKGQDV